MRRPLRRASSRFRALAAIERLVAGQALRGLGDPRGGPIWIEIPIPLEDEMEVLALPGRLRWAPTDDQLEVDFALPLPDVLPVVHMGSQRLLDAAQRGPARGVRANLDAD